MLQGVGQLVGTGGRTTIAGDATRASYDLLRLLPLDKRADALRVAVTTSEEEDLLNDVVVIQFDVNHFRAGALSDIINLFHRS